MRWNTFPLRFKILALILPLSFVPILVVGGPAYWFLSETLLLTAEAERAQAAADAAQSVAELRRDLGASALHLAELPDVQRLFRADGATDVQREAALDAADSVVSLQPDIVRVAIVDRNAREVLPATDADRDATGDTQTRSRSDDRSPHPSGSFGSPIVLRHPVTIAGATRGDVRLEVDSEAVFDILRESASRHDVGFLLYERGGLTSHRQGHRPSRRKRDS